MYASSGRQLDTIHTRSTMAGEQLTHPGLVWNAISQGRQVSRSSTSVVKRGVFPLAAVPQRL